jgi:polyhydroxyalkanoate synthesis regulator phasin
MNSADSLSDTSRERALQHLRQAERLLREETEDRHPLETVQDHLAAGLAALSALEQKTIDYAVDEETAPGDLASTTLYLLSALSAEATETQLDIERARQDRSEDRSDPADMLRRANLGALAEQIASLRRRARDAEKKVRALREQNEDL